MAKIVGAAWSFYSDVYLLDNGQVFTHRVNLSGSIDILVFLKELTYIRQVTAGSNWNLALTRAGDVLAWGKTTGDGRLGERWEGGSLQPLEPGKVMGLPKICGIGAGEYFSAALDEEGAVWGWGSNLDLVINPEGNMLQGYERPVKIAGFRDIRAITCGSRNIFGLDSAGKVWTQGNNFALQRGCEDAPAQATAVPGLPPAKLIFAKGQLGVAVDQDGGVWYWGDPGELSGVPHGKRSPQMIQGLPVVFRGRIQRECLLFEDINRELWSWSPPDTIRRCPEGEGRSVQEAAMSSPASSLPLMGDMEAVQRRVGGRGLAL